MKKWVYEGKVWTGWKGECQCKPWNTPSMYIYKPMEDGLFICNILKKFFGKKVRITIEPITQSKKR